MKDRKLSFLCFFWGITTIIAQLTQVSDVVTTSGDNVPDVSIIAPRIQAGSGLFGNHVFTVPEGMVTLVFPYIGFESQEVDSDSRTAIDNQLLPDQTVPDDRPNFLFVLVDDQTYDALSHVGRYPFLRTPNLDQLIEEGVYFSNAFVTHSLCSPSRASFLTGTYSFTHGVTTNRPDVDPDWEKTSSYPQILRQEGYETAFVGKMHMAHLSGKDQPRPGYSYWLGFEGQGEYINPILNENGQDYQAKGYITDILTDSTIAWIRHKRDKSRPFSINLFHKAIHGPFIPSERDQNAFENAEMAEPATYNQDYGGKPEWYKRRTAWRQGKERWKRAYGPVPSSIPIIPWSEEIKDSKHSNMLKCLLAVDESMGRLKQALREEGLLENTVIIYSSDNGYYLGDHSMRDKRSAYEASIRIPLIISYPALTKQAQVQDAMVINTDIAPTILDLAGIEDGPDMQGISLLPLLKNEPIPWRESFLYVYYRDIIKYHMVIPDMIAIRTKNHKYIRYPNSSLQKEELYDLRVDALEANNLIDNKDHRFITTEMSAMMDSLKDSLGYSPDAHWLTKSKGLPLEVIWNWREKKLEKRDTIIPFD